jgi:hypothetical protein
MVFRSKLIKQVRVEEGRGPDTDHNSASQFRSPSLPYHIRGERYLCRGTKVRFGQIAIILQAILIIHRELTLSELSQLIWQRMFSFPQPMQKFTLRKTLCSLRCLVQASPTKQPSLHTLAEKSMRKCRIDGGIEGDLSWLSSAVW